MANPLFSRTDNFFEALRSRWAAIPPGIKDSFLQQTPRLVDLESRLRQDEELLAYDQQIYPELVTLFKLPETPPSDLTRRAEVHFCTQQIHLMESVFLALRLGEFHSHPVNRGWMNLFRRWAAAQTFRTLWLSLRGMYGKEFVEFAEYQLNLATTAQAAIQVFSTSLPDHLAPDEFTKLFMRPAEDQHVDPTLGGVGAQPKRMLPIARWPFDLTGLVLTRTGIHLGSGVAPRLPSEIPHDIDRFIEELNQEWPIERYRPYWEQLAWQNVIFIISNPELSHAVPGEHAWGAVLVGKHPTLSNSYRLILWIRPGYRRLGLGTQLLREVVSHVPETVLKSLLILLPPLARDKPGYGQEMSGWLHFFGKAGFVRMSEGIIEMQEVGFKIHPQAFCLAYRKQ